MGRFIGIDFGLKRCGVAVTDPLSIIVQPLQALKREELYHFLTTYMAQEQVEAVIFGMPAHSDGTPTDLQPHIRGMMRRLNKDYPQLRVDEQDEAYSSSEAEQLLRQTLKKGRRRSPQDVDVLSAVLILQRYLGHID